MAGYTSPYPCYTATERPGDLDWLGGVGAIETHAHIGVGWTPDGGKAKDEVAARVVDDRRAIELCDQFRLLALVRKSHNYGLVERNAGVAMAARVMLEAGLIRHVPGHMNMITLNNSVGGVSPVTVKTFAKAGGDIIMGFTFSGRRQREVAHQIYVVQGSTRKPPPWKEFDDALSAAGYPNPSLSFTDEVGRVTEEAEAVLRICIDENLVFATGHAGPDEILALAAVARELCEESGRPLHFMVTHPLFECIEMTIADQVRVAEMETDLFRVYFEHTFLQMFKGTVSMDDTIGSIMSVQPHQVILASDSGAADGPNFVQCLARWRRFLEERGFSDDRIHAIFWNPRAIYYRRDPVAFAAAMAE